MTRRFLTTMGVLAAGSAAYAYAETKHFRLQHHRLQVGPEVPPLKILHLSDTHMRAADTERLAFLRALPTLIDTPDVVCATGDLIENDSGIEPLLETLEGITSRFGRFYVFGSHDYFQSTFRFPLRYLFTREAAIDRLPLADTERLSKGLDSQGWVDVMNRTEMVPTPFGRIRVAGVDDPHIKRHRTDHIARGADEALAIALVHAPDVVSEWALNHFDLILAGHTHGGQVRAPFFGALVTNSSVPRGLAMGPNRVGDSWLHLSPGLGVSTSPLRFLCRPEITLLELVPGSSRARS